MLASTRRRLFTFLHDTWLKAVQDYQLTGAFSGTDIAEIVFEEFDINDLADDEFALDAWMRMNRRDKVRLMKQAFNPTTIWRVGRDET